MIFITGGAFQGQEECAGKYEGRSGYTVIRSFHLMVKDWLDKGLDPDEELSELFKTDKTLVFVTDEIGGGIIPVDEDERRWREVHGRLCCRIAAMADEVCRMTCGIATRIR